LLNPENEIDEIIEKLFGSFMMINMLAKIARPVLKPKPNFAEGGPTSRVHESGERTDTKQDES
jgi:hypothetical protein